MKTTAVPAEASAAAPASNAVHTSALNAKPSKPAHHQPSPRPQRDEFTGKGGTYQRDPNTGVRTRVEPPAAPAGGNDTPAAA